MRLESTADIYLKSREHKSLFKIIASDPSFYTLLLANILIIFLALRNHWSLGMIIGVYIIQSALIVLFSSFDILASHTEMKIGKRIGVVFLLIFSFAYITSLFEFILSLYDLSLFPENERALILKNSTFFLLHYIIAFFIARSHTSRGGAAKNSLIFPFTRIFPLQITLMFLVLIVTIFNINILLAVFLFIKTLIDLVIHVVETKMLSDSEI